MQRSKSLKWQAELTVACAAADLGQGILTGHFGNLSKVEEKFQAGLVSEADRESEDVISQHLIKHNSTYSILGEETGLTAGKKIQNRGKDVHVGRWIIDPLDGTNNYVHQLLVFCISIALEVDGEIVVAVIDAPMLRQRFTATKGGGAFLNDSPIHVSQRKKFSEFLLATGFNPQKKDDLETQVRVFAEMIGRARGIRRLGAAAYDLCLVAQGVFDAFWEQNLQPWDTAAGMLLVQEAGGVVSDYRGREYTPYTNGIVVGTTESHAKILETIQLIYGV